MSPTRRYLLFLLLLVALCLALLAAGYLPTRAAGGAAAIDAMVLACGVALIGSALGGLPIARARESGPEGLKLFMISMGLRLLVVVLLALAVLFGLDPARGPFLLWLGVSYLVLLTADTGYAWTTFRRL